MLNHAAPTHTKAAPDSIYLQQLILALTQRILDPLHDSQYFLFLKASTNDLHAHRKTMHLLRII
jgi:hypothetical protein